MTDFNQAWLWAVAVAGDPNTAVFDFRAINDVRKDIPAIPFRGTLGECWNSIQTYNSQGYGIFAVVSAMDGIGRELANVDYIRAHFIDLDNLSSQQNYEAAARSVPAPSLAVQTSPGKFHVYWSVQPYRDNTRFELLQRKLRQVYDSDKIIDPTRVMRLPGTLHQKRPGEPHSVTCWQLAGFGQWHAPEALEAALAGVNVIDGGSGTRHDLGDPTLAAPSLDWLRYGLTLVDPNSLTRGEWIAITSAVKQAGWSLTDADVLFNAWSEWCARYNENDLGENLKQWNSIRNTELGWQSLLNRIPALRAAFMLGGVNRSQAMQPMQPSNGHAPMPEQQFGEMLTPEEQREYFKGCMFVVNLGSMLTPNGRLMNVTTFNAEYGGKKFIIDSQGKVTNEPWAAATRSTMWTVPKVDHIRFLPSAEFHAVLTDELGRKGVNLYRPVQPRRMAGDPSPFLNQVAALFPVASDQKIILDYLAHNVKYPGHKIPWAPVLQSAEGAGKGLIKQVMTAALGKPYVYFPNAKELTNSGSQFNAWMRNKLFIVADEIKVDDRRDLIEVLKPMISEKTIEVQGKGQNQELEDNYSNWLFFTNWKDAIPISANARRYAVFFSPLQTARDLLMRGMDEVYFDSLYKWAEADGAAIVTDFLLNYPIERGAIPMRAPQTSTTAEAIALTRSPIERVLIEAVEDELPGFRGGWISSIAAVKRLKESGAMARSASPQVIGTVAESLGYVACGRSPRAYFAEGDGSNNRAQLWHYAERADVRVYGSAQGWE